MTSKTSRVCLTILVLVVLGAIASHGVVVPRFIWQPRLDAIQAEHPDLHLNADHVVLALNLHPKLMVTGLSVKADQFDESTRVDLLSASINGWKSLTQWQWVPEEITLKRLTLQTGRQADCTLNLRDCVPRTPFAALGLLSRWINNHGSDVAAVVPAVQVQQASLELNKPGEASSMQAFIDQFSLNLQPGNPNHPAELNAALRLLGNKASGRALYITLKAYPRIGSQTGDTGLELDQVAIQANGQWAGFPWSGNLTSQLLALEGYPIVKVRLQDFKSYLRRDDAPDSHQAALAIAKAEGGLPNQAWDVHQAEWTYTADQASAWAFNLKYEPEQKQVLITPAAPQTVDSQPAEAQVRSLNCKADDTQYRHDKPIWAWNGSWFEVVNHVEDAAGSPLVLCPVKAGLPAVQAVGASPGL